MWFQKPHAMHGHPLVSSQVSLPPYPPVCFPLGDRLLPLELYAENFNLGITSIPFTTIKLNHRPNSNIKL